MIPIFNCPICKIVVPLIYDFYINICICSNKEKCPIKFSERVDSNGFLLSYQFEIENNLIKVIPDCNKIYIYPNITNSKGNAKGRIILNMNFDLNWFNTKLLDNKIKTWILFS